MRTLRASTLARFNVISLLGMAALAAVLGLMLQRQIVKRATDHAVMTTQVIAEVAVRRYVPRGDLQNELIPETRNALDDHLISDQLEGLGVERVKLFDSRARMVYTNDGAPIGDVAPPGSNVRTALAGKRIHQVSRGTDDDGLGQATLSVYAPLRYPMIDEPVGVVEVYLDFAPAQAVARRDVRTMWAAVGGGLLVLWLLLFRVVSRVSRDLRGQVDANRRQATCDALTGLPNRTLLFERLAEALDAGSAALLQLDVDGFREINDTLGHDHGDELLVEVARRLRACTAEGDVVARLGGDEFAVLRPGAVGERAATRLAETLSDALHAPIDIRGTTVVVDTTIGIALAPEHGDCASELARRAEIAMYQAKSRHGGVRVYCADDDHHHRDRLELLAELGGAIRRGELVLAYQPKIDLASGRIKGVEALVRWQHPRRGLLSPGAFVPAAEVTSLVRPLTLHVVDAALRAHRRWADDGLVLPVAVNLAGPSVMDAGLPQAVANLLADHRVPANALTLEISEGTMMQDVDSALRVLEAFRALGVRLSLDDFGTGQTSLGQLRMLPLDELKVDRSLVIGDDRMLASVVGIAHKFGLRAVGEGVETCEVAEALAATGCDEAQGFLFARPMWADEIPAWVAGRAVAVAT